MLSFCFKDKIKQTKIKLISDAGCPQFMIGHLATVQSHNGPPWGGAGGRQLMTRIQSSNGEGPLCPPPSHPSPMPVLWPLSNQLAFMTVCNH